MNKERTHMHHAKIMTDCPKRRSSVSANLLFAFKLAVGCAVAFTTVTMFLATNVLVDSIGRETTYNDGPTNATGIAIAVDDNQKVDGAIVPNSELSTKNNNHNRIGRSEVIDVNDGATFSACLLWMDDNHRLEEWLAYHYFVLNLRHVVLTIDVNSKTSPQAIVDRWNHQEHLNMTIVTLNEKDYVEDYPGWMDKIAKAKSETEIKLGIEKTNYHRHRQHAFYRSCSEHLIEKNRGWTSYHDSDEFISFQWENKLENRTEIEQEKLKQPGYIAHRLNAIRDRFPPEIHAENNTGVSCVIIPRIRYCAKEMRQTEINDVASTYIPEGFTNNNNNTERVGFVKRLETLRFKYATPGWDGQPKSFIDLRNINAHKYVNRTFHKKENNHKWGTHLPMRGMCSEENQKRLPQAKKLLEEERLVMNHYLGSWESYSFRDDARRGSMRTYEVWKERANMTIGEYSHVVRPWLQGFVDRVGTSVAAHLLQDAGVFQDRFDFSSQNKEFYKYRFNFNSGKENETRQSTKIIGNRGVNFVKIFGKIKESEDE